MGTDEATTGTLYCSFCEKSQHEVIRLLSGPKVSICDDCAWLYLCIIADVDPPDEIYYELYDEVVTLMQQHSSNGTDG